MHDRKMSLMTRRMDFKKRRHSGYLIVYAMILMFGLLSVMLVALTIASATYTYTKDDVHRQNAAYMAKACVSIVADELTANSSFSGFSPADKTLFDRTGEHGGKATCKVDSIADGDGSQKIIQLTTSVYRSDSDTSPVTYRAQAVLNAPTVGVIDGDYLKGGVLVGNGGMTMEGVGSIQASRMNVLGNLSLSGSIAFRVGYGYGPVNVYNIACGTTDWPKYCTGQNPIQMNGSAVIQADICAPGQSSTSGLVFLDTSCAPLPEITMPPFDKAGFIDGLTGPTINGSDVTALGGCYESIGIPGYYRGKTYHIPAGATITGDIDLSDIPAMQSNPTTCTIAFDGDAYITGAIIGNLGSSSRVNMIVDDGVSEDITIVMNRQMHIGGAERFAFKSGFYGYGDKFAHIINFSSSNTACSDSDTIPSNSASTCLTPLQAKTSATDDTYKGLYISSGGGYKNLSGVTYYAYYSMLDLGCESGYIEIAAVAAQRLVICDGSSAIKLTADDPTFGIEAGDSDGGGSYRVIDFFQR